MLWPMKNPTITPGGSTGYTFSLFPGGNMGGDSGPDAGTSQSTSESHSGQKFANNDLASSLANVLGGVAGDSATSFMDYLKNPVDSPLFQSQLGALLNSLRPSEANARQSLADTFRAAGGLRSGAYGNSAGSLENDILGNREKTAANLLGQSFGPMTQAMLGAMGQINPLLQALKMSYSDSESQSTGTNPLHSPVMTGPTGISGGGGGGGFSGFAGPVGVNPGQSSYYGSMGTPGTNFSGGMSMTPDLSNGPTGMGWGGTPDYYQDSDYGNPSGGMLGSTGDYGIFDQGFGAYADPMEY